MELSQNIGYGSTYSTVRLNLPHDSQENIYPSSPTELLRLMQIGSLRAAFDVIFEASYPFLYRECIGHEKYAIED